MTNIEDSFEPFFNDISTNDVLIPFNKQNSSNKTKTQQVVIDSRDRDIIKYPSQNKYNITFLEPFRNVVDVELVASSIPLSRSIITDDNNVFTYSIGTGIKQNVIFKKPERDMYIETFIYYIDQMIDINVSYKPSNETVEFSRFNNFTIYFSENPSLAKLLGFAQEDLVSKTISTTYYNLVSDHQVTYTHMSDVIANEYIVMKIKHLNILTSNNKILNNATSIIYKTTDHTNINNNDIIHKRFSPPLSILNFDVTFYDYYGNLYDFNNTDHLIHLKFTTLKEGRRF